MTIDEFLKRARNIHGDKYDYSKVDLNNRDEKGRVCIICPIHGEFWQIPSNHLKGKGCFLCNGGVKKDKSDFIKKAREIHGNKYDYSKVEYINAHTKVCISCPIHGEFWQTPANHLCGKGCLKCVGKNKTTDFFIEEAKKIHGNKYDYSKTVYINAHAKVCIICPIHGEFWQTPNNHLMGNGCYQCGLDIAHKKQTLTKEEFIRKAHLVHGDKYDYSKVEYINYETPICIICPVHGEFWQTPDKHLHGAGCPMCKSSKLEEEMRLFLQENNIIFERQKHFDWLGFLSLDFYLPQYNIAIECQGIQHFKSIEFFGGHNGFLQNKIRDERKRRLCEENGIRLLYYSNLGIEYPYEVYENKEELLEEIKRL